MSAPRPVNHYIRRLAGTDKSCFVCYRPTPHVLVSQSLPTEDFFYVCESHLRDRHFATQIAAAEPSGGSGGGGLPEKVSQAEIDKVKAEYEERQKKREEAKAKKEDDKKKEDDDKDGKDKKDKEKSWFSGLSALLDVVPTADSKASTASSSSAGSPAASASAKPAAAASGKHERYALHRDFYNMRLDAYRKKDALKRAKELAMPAAPRGEPRPPATKPAS